MLAVFCGGVLFFSRFMNTEAIETASDLQDATLPVLYANIDGTRYNRMFGYTQEMSTRDMRGGLIPITTERTLCVSYRQNDSEVLSVSYEVTAPDSGEVLENAKIGDFKEDGSELRTAQFSLHEPILMNREYPIRFTLTTKDGEAHYYARLLQRADLLTKDYITFVNDFYETCFNKSAAKELSVYLETDESAQNNAYTHCDIHSSVEQITWGSLNPTVYRKGVPKICEINNTTCSLTNEYVITADNEGTAEYYRVEEFYRLRYYKGRMRLLDFERTTLQYFDGEEGRITSEGIFLGLAERGVPFKTNADGRIVAFVQDHALWVYKEATARLVQVFSFEDYSEEGDERDEDADHGIKIIRVSEGGDIDFLVYGRILRGEREGQSGVMVCHFYGEATTVQETAFLACPMPYEYLAQDLEKLSYVNNHGDAYLYLNRKIVKVSPRDGSATVVLSDIHPDCIVAAESQDRVAWMDEMDPNHSTKLTVMELEEGTTTKIAAEKNQLLRALGFVSGDFIYGIARPKDLVTYPAGNVLFPMAELRIISPNGELVKTYAEEPYFVGAVKIAEGLVELTRLMHTDKGYLDAGPDNIASNKQGPKSEVRAETTISQRQGSCVLIRMPNQGRSLHPKREVFRVKKAGADALVEKSIAHDDKMPLYYVYTRGHLQKVTADPSQAVQMADEGVGTVVNNEGQYIYERGTLQVEQEIDNIDIPGAVLTGEVDAAKLQEALGDEATVMNLSGCTLDQVLYELSVGRPVISCAADGSTVVIVGYNEYNTRLYNFADGTHYYFGINDSREAFEKGGNVFVSIVEPQETIKK